MSGNDKYLYTYRTFFLHHDDNSLFIEKARLLVFFIVVNFLLTFYYFLKLYTGIKHGCIWCSGIICLPVGICHVCEVCYVILAYLFMRSFCKQLINTRQ